MNEQQLKEYLKEHLKIQLSSEESILEVQLLLDGEVISSDTTFYYY